MLLIPNYMTLKKSLANIVLVGALTLGGTGCDTQYKEGRVIKESGTVVNIVESGGALFGNESVKLGNPSYILTVETDEGKYVISVSENYDKPLVALAEAIEVGDKIRFVKTDMNQVYFSKDRIGRNYSNNIELIGK